MDRSRLSSISSGAADESTSSVSMYYSFSTTMGDKTIEAQTEDEQEIICVEVDSSQEHQNSTLEADVSQLKTVVKTGTTKLATTAPAASPLRALPKNILREYKALSSTPTKVVDVKCEVLKRRSVINDLGIAFLEKIEPISVVTVKNCEDKENVPVGNVSMCEKKGEENAKEKKAVLIVDKEDNVVTSGVLQENIIDENKPSEENKNTLKVAPKPEKKIRFSTVPMPANTTTQKKTARLSLKPRKSIMKPSSEPDLKTNKPSRISTSGKRPSLAVKKPSEFSPSDITKVLSKLIREAPIEKKSSTSTTNSSQIVKKQMSRVSMYVEQKVRIKQTEKPFKLVTKATRMSIVKTTLNSSARRNSLRGLNSSLLKNHARKSIAPVSNMRKSLAPIRRNTILVKPRKSLTPPTVDPTKRIRKSLAPKPVEKTKSIPAPKPAPKTSATGLKDGYTCSVCARKFRVSSLFEAHKKTHDASTSRGGGNIANSKQCKYCDKKFAIEKALSNHLLENCPKIPAGDKKKLLFPKEERPKATTTSICSNESLFSTSSNKSDLKSDDTMPPPSSNKIKKKIAVHSGIYRTPTKRIDCHPCKRTFNNILSYTEHCMAVHNLSGATTDDETDTKATAESETQIQDGTVS